MLASFFNLWSFSYTSRAGLFIFLSGEFLLHIPCWLFFFFFFQGIFSYTPRSGFIFIRGISLTHPVLVLFLGREFLLHISYCLYFCGGSFSYTSQAAFIFMWRVAFICMWGVSLTHPMLAFFMQGISLTHPELSSSLCLTHPVLAFCYVRRKLNKKLPR